MNEARSYRGVFAGGNRPSIQRANLSIQIYDFLESEIVSGNIPPGTKLSEVAIADDIGVSRQPVREAISRLERLGLASRGGRDRFVAWPTEQLIADTYEVWWVLDSARTYLASLAAPQAAIDRMRELLEEMEEATRSADQGRLDRSSAEFHDLISRKSDNARLEAALQSCALHMRWFRNLYLKDRRPSEARLEDHRRILECYARKDLAGLIDVIRTHVLRRRDEVLEACQPDRQGRAGSSERGLRARG